jgi:hypothetical protein
MRSNGELGWPDRKSLRRGEEREIGNGERERKNKLNKHMRGRKQSRETN